MMQSERYLTEKEVSEMTRIAPQTLRNNRFRGLGIPYCKIGKSIRYALSDVIQFMERGKIKTSQF